MKHWENWACFSDLSFTWYQRNSSEIRHLFNRKETSGFWEGPEIHCFGIKLIFLQICFLFQAKFQLHFVKGCDIPCLKGALSMCLCFQPDPSFQPDPFPASERKQPWLSVSPFLALFHLVLFGFWLVLFFWWFFFVILKSNPSFPFQEPRSVKAAVAGIPWK